MDDAIRFWFIISVRVASIFDPQSLLIGILKAAKMRARANSVNSLRHRNNFGVNCARGEPVWSSGAHSV
jgi:hypothetical protein